MSFLIKLSIFFMILFVAIFTNYSGYDKNKKLEELKEISSKIYLKPSFIFKSKKYKEFVYAK
ncbi:hypothetical protein CRV08_03740 [Halarcobacter ebronensis]|uniref:Uncharacterized protein n=1 Tax=Halarcobacter ebronensis TaxID=1462615 RepID=A0A4Q0YG24_9BACT|nr:hypothetical protein [Halarcobacter ebronensis]RXJ69135.1 hypothetical protein CRV08_03740 [Halarcobacter ebronensis]